MGRDCGGGYCIRACYRYVVCKACSRAFVIRLTNDFSAVYGSEGLGLHIGLAAIAVRCQVRTTTCVHELTCDTTALRRKTQ